MRVLTSTLLIGAAAAAVYPAQQVLDVPKDLPQKAADAVSEPFHDLKEKLKTFTDDVQELWEEVSSAFPGSMENLPFYSAPKKHTRRPDSHWDHIVRGADVQSIWVENADGEKEREVDGKLEEYDLRVKAVDPSSLGVDPGVKQYSGYLDDNENDKHLFYCMTPPPPLLLPMTPITNVVQGSSSLVTTPRMTPSCCG
jgi:cathepsin A (carboxypeptidase C)